MARPAVVVLTVVLHILLGKVYAMPGPGPPSRRSVGGPRLQCASCLLPFGTARAVRIHQAAMGPSSPCGSQRLAPVTSSWSGRGPRAAGRVEDLSGPRGRLSGVSDPDSDIDGGRSPRRMEEDLHGGPAGAQEEDPVHEQEDRAPPEQGAWRDQVLKICTKYVHIRTYTYTY